VELVTLRQGTQALPEFEDEMTVSEMAQRFEAYDHETLAFTFGDWVNMTWLERDVRQAEIDAKHNYKHGWIVIDGQSFDRYQAFPNQQFSNVWD